MIQKGKDVGEEVKKDKHGGRCDRRCGRTRSTSLVLKNSFFWFLGCFMPGFLVQ